MGKWVKERMVIKFWPKESWALKRVLFYLYYLLVILSGGLMAYVLAPLSSYMFFQDFRFWKHIRHFAPGIKTAYHQLYLIFTNKKYREMFSIPLTAPPMKQPDKYRLGLSPSWKTGADECQGCSSCCIKLGCGLFDREKGTCHSYDSFFWRYFNCGRYPRNQKEIDFYECPKWVIKEELPRFAAADPKSQAAQCNYQ